MCEKSCTFADDMANEIEKLKVELPDAELTSLAERIANEVDKGKRALSISINATITETYWNVGRYIVEFEQQGNAKSKYGSSLLTKLSKLLQMKVGRGYSRPNLNNMRKFYLLYPICQTVSDKLTWSHICELITIEDPLEREFYEKECIAENWGVKTLHRQMESGLFMRLALSKDKEGVLALAHEGQQVQTPEDVVKNTYTLEFLGIEERKRYKEKDLEEKLIDNMQLFLLELGKGFTFVKRT